MNYGALIFLSGLLALSFSWFGLVLGSQLQVGRQPLTKVTGTADQYPSRRPGLAEQGLQVYRANGCVTCHSQQTRQTGTVFDVVLGEVGTNQSALVAALAALPTKLNESSLSALPQDVLRGVDKSAAEGAEKTLKPTGAKFAVLIRPVGPDIDRGWGRRGTVAADFLQDSPVLLGAQRLGPDLANVGVRQPDVRWHLNHLYAPGSTVKGSTMPAYRFLFEKRPVGAHRSALALDLPAEFVPAGYEIVPNDEAIALTAYLTSLRADAALYEAPLSVPAPAAASTNSPAK